MNGHELDQQLLNRPDVKRIREQKKFAYEIADMIFDARAKQGVTQAELARRVGTKQPSIARIESGEELPSISFLKRIAEALGMELIAPKFCVRNQNIRENRSKKPALVRN